MHSANVANPGLKPLYCWGPFAGLKAHASTQLERASQTPAPGSAEPFDASRDDRSNHATGRFLDSRAKLRRTVSSPEPVRIRQRPSGVDLRVNVGTISLKNPIIAASGTFGYGVEFAPMVDLKRLGGIVVKGLSRESMAGSPAPRMAETASGMINAIGLQNIGVRAFVAERLPELRRYETAIIANVFGRTVADYVEVIRVLEDAEGIAAYELNVSCPNVDRGGAEFGVDPVLTGEVVQAAARASSRPLWVKLSPVVGKIGLTATAAESEGADAVVIANTYPALCIDAHTRRSRLGSTTGGLSGAAIKPITVRLVYEASRVIQIPIIGLGGIEGPEDVAEYMLVGASAVEVGTAHFVDPRASERLVGELEIWCRDENLFEISNLRGSLES
jgi:dihydroorotate dehydrogenase (NAD+) catalytic subunit